MNRRIFIARSSYATSGLWLNKTWSDLLPYQGPKPGGISILATNWGFNGSFSEFCALAAKTGYDGIEVWVPDQSDLNLYRDETQKHQLKLGLLTGSGGQTPEDHLISYQKALDRALRLSPVYINSHAGKDHFTLKQNAPLIQAALTLSRQSGIPIYQETHRGRILYSASLSQEYFAQFQDLRITLDISHWCNVHESLLEDQASHVQVALSRTGHIHARVGHAEGPQVTDPRAPEWQSALNVHLSWWDQVVEQKVRNGQPVTILTEFGPPDYMPVVPYTGQPLADNWKINAFMLEFLRKRYTR